MKTRKNNILLNALLLLIILINCSNVDRLNPFDQKNPFYSPQRIPFLRASVSKDSINLEWDSPVFSANKAFKIFKSCDTTGFHPIDTASKNRYMDFHGFKAGDSNALKIKYQVKTLFSTQDSSLSDILEISFFNASGFNQTRGEIVVNVSDVDPEGKYLYIFDDKSNKYILRGDIKVQKYFPQKVDSNSLNSFISYRIEPDNLDLNLPVYVWQLCFWIGEDIKL
ncbi:MAG: hypothetical protein ABIA63_14730 [bacterium]